MADIATGTTITFQSGLLAGMTSIAVNGQERAALDIPTLDPTNVVTRLIGNLATLPTIVCDLLLDPDADMAAVLAAAAETVTVTFPLPTGLTTPATWVFQGAATAFEAGMPAEEAMTGTITISATTIPVYTAAA